MKAVSNRSTPARRLRFSTGFRSELLVFGMVFTTQGARSMYLVIVSWFTLHLTNELSAAAKALIAWHLFSLLAGPFLGTLVDRFRRRYLFMAGQLLVLIVTIGLALYIWTFGSSQFDLFPVYLSTGIASLGALLAISSSQALLQSMGRVVLSRVVASGILFNQLGLVAGAAVGGVSMNLLGMAPSLVICAGFATGAVLLAVFLPSEMRQLQNGGHRAEEASVAAGFNYIRQDRNLRLSCLTVVLAYSAGLLVYAMLAAFVRFELKLQADAYGYIASLWATGGIAGSFFLIAMPGSLKRNTLLRYGLLLLALATIGFSTAQDFWQAIIWHGAMGVFYTLTRTSCEAYILTKVANTMIGRVQANIQASIGVTGILVYLVPTYVSDIPIRQTYFCLAAAVAVASLLIIAAQSKAFDAQH